MLSTHCCHRVSTTTERGRVTASAMVARTAKYGLLGAGLVGGTTGLGRMGELAFRTTSDRAGHVLGVSMLGGATLGGTLALASYGTERWCGFSLVRYVFPQIAAPEAPAATPAPAPAPPAAVAEITTPGVAAAGPARRVLAPASLRPPPPPPAPPIVSSVAHHNAFERVASTPSDHTPLLATNGTTPSTAHGTAGTAAASTTNAANAANAANTTSSGTRPATATTTPAAANAANTQASPDSVSGARYIQLRARQAAWGQLLLGSMFEMASLCTGFGIVFLFNASAAGDLAAMATTVGIGAGVLALLLLAGVPVTRAGNWAYQARRGAARVI